MRIHLCTQTVIHPPTRIYTRIAIHHVSMYYIHTSIPRTHLSADNHHIAQQISKLKETCEHMQMRIMRICMLIVTLLAYHIAVPRSNFNADLLEFGLEVLAMGTPVRVEFHC